MKGPSLEKLPVKVPHQRSPFAMKFEDRSQEGTERQERCARGKAWNLAKNIYNLKEKDKAAFYFPAEEWVLPAASRKEPEEREFVVDSAAGTHTASEKDLDSAELETMRISKNPTTVMTAIGEVETREDTTVYVKELDLFVAVMLLEETPAILSLGKLCEDHEFFIPLDQWSKTTSHQKWQKNQVQKSEIRSIPCPWSVDEFLYFIFTCFFNIFVGGYCDQHGKSCNRKK